MIVEVYTAYSKMIAIHLALLCETIESVSAILTRRYIDESNNNSNSGV
jgi:hypothetical protein